MFMPYLVLESSPMQKIDQLLWVVFLKATEISAIFNPKLLLGWIEYIERRCRQQNL